MENNKSCCGGGCSCSHDEELTTETCPSCENNPCTCSMDNESTTDTSEK